MTVRAATVRDSREHDADFRVAEDNQNERKIHARAIMIKVKLAEAINLPATISPVRIGAVSSNS